MKKYTYHAALTVAIVFWGASYIVTAIAYQTIAPLQLGFVRALLAALSVFAYRRAAGVREELKRQDIVPVAVSALFGVTLYFALQNLGLDYTSSSNAALIVAAYPALVMALDSIVHRTAFSARTATGIALAVIGVGILTSGAASQGSNALLGNALLVAAGVMWFLYCTAMQRVASKYSILTLTAWQMLFGACFFFPLALLEGQPWQMPTPVSAAAVLFLAVCCSLIAFLCYNYALTGLTMTSAAAMLNLMPIVGLVCSALVLHEPITARQLIGGAIVILGVLLSGNGGKA